MRYIFEKVRVKNNIILFSVLSTMLVVKIYACNLKSNTLKLFSYKKSLCKLCSLIYRSRTTSVLKNSRKIIPMQKGSRNTRHKHSLWMLLRSTGNSAVLQQHFKIHDGLLQAVLQRDPRLPAKHASG